MKQVNKILALGLVALMPLSGFSQINEQVSTGQRSSKKDNWFISIGAGPNLLFGEEDSHISASNRIDYSAELSVGKWFTPVFGTRLQLFGGEAKGWNYEISQGGYYIGQDRSVHRNWQDLYDAADMEFTKNGDPFGNGFYQPITHFGASIDLMANMSTLFRGYYKEGNLVDFIPFVGVGYLRSFAGPVNPNTSSYVGKIGMRTNFNLNNKIALFLEVQGNITDKEFDGYVGNRNFDGLGSALVGVHFSINKGFTNSMMGMSQEEIDRINQKINEQDRRINELENRPERECPPSTSETLVLTDTDVKLPEYIRFPLNSAEISGIETDKMEMAAAFLNANPDAKVLLVGYADKKTGNPKYNLSLSEKRVNAVVKGLVVRGISADRFIQRWEGDSKQPFQDNDWNRVVVMLQR